MIYAESDLNIFKSHIEENIFNAIVNDDINYIFNDEINTELFKI